MDEINDSKYILDLQEGWGDNGAPISLNVYQSSIEFVLNYSGYILNIYKIAISTPEIKPVRDGSIDLVWNTDLAYMAINIKLSTDGLLGTFFSFKHENKKIKEGELDLTIVESDTAYWMTSLK